ncbi:pirin family protein [Williamsia sterculiae]|uniref:Pirin N-terminal domain-containing protein n=1 Tax=Williamsia sterculiae TaxID=1344003 RepID=A0A1N7CDV9_9NOCA|nr:pirin family protein [Williamsia sterculiae]SIR61755.1 hypothetical protein SAMN05445060_0063 [Williamsia sterculiae]
MTTSRVIRADDRYHWSNEWLESWQSFPMAGNFDLRTGAHGLLMVHNDDIVESGEGLDRHRHQDVEVVTWVVEGALEHRDSGGNTGVLTPGTVQVMSAGSGVDHSERNAAARSTHERLRVIQMWVPPEYPGGKPAYAERDVASLLASGELIILASGTPGTDPGVPHIRNPYVTLHAARLTGGASISLPEARFGHMFVVTGRVDVDGDQLSAGDALRTVAAGAGLTVTSLDDCELLFWQMSRGFAGQTWAATPADVESPHRVTGVAP